MPDETPTGADEPRFRADMKLVEKSLSEGWWAQNALLERLRCVPRMLAAKNVRMGRVLDDTELEDLAQETLLSVWKRREQYQGRSSIETWVYTFCYHHFMNRVRREAHKPRTKSLEAAGGVAAREGRDFGFVYRALTELGPPAEEIVRLRHFERLPFAEIGDVLGISPNTAKSRYYAGIERLRTILGSARMEDDA